MDPLAEALRGSPYGGAGNTSDTWDAIRKIVSGLWSGVESLPKRAIEGANVYAQTGDPSQVIGPAADTAMNMFGVGGPAAMLRGGAALGAAGGKVRATVDALGGELPKYPQYAEHYPPSGPPVLADKKTMKPVPGVPGHYLDASSPAQQSVDAGVNYWSKELTPEQQAFAKERTRIQKDMDKNGYTPYFDPTQRAPVDPAGYPTSLDMTRDAMPAKQKTIDNYKAMFDTPEGRARLQAGFEAGQTVPGADRWYHMKQLQDEFIKEYGPEVGAAEFRKRFAQSMAATTGGADPTANFLTSHYANFLDKQGADFPRGVEGQVASHQVPYPVGGRYVGGNLKQYEMTVGEPTWGGFDANNPKRFDFEHAFLGHPNSMTMDEQMTSGLKPGVNMPPGDSYGIAAGVGHDLARINGVAPVDFQDVTWAGLKKLKVEGAGKQFNYEGPMINHINDAIERTSRLTGMSPEEVVKRGIVRQEIPIYSGPASPFGFSWNANGEQ